jgi:hypothetical protein
MVKQTLYRMGSKFTNHDPTGVAPIDLVHRFPKETPIAFITSKTDTLVPAACTKTLAYLLANVGHSHVYLLELEHSSHPRYMMDNEEDRNKYQWFAHALYKKYGLPHIEKYALAGESLLTQCALSGI